MRYLLSLYIKIVASLFLLFWPVFLAWAVTPWLILFALVAFPGVMLMWLEDEK